MTDENKLNFEAEITQMSALIETLQKLSEVKERLKNIYWNKAVNLSTGFNRPETDIEIEELYERSYEKEIDVFQLNAEIKQKHIVLAELKKRADEDNAKTELLVKQADMSLEDRIKQAKELSNDLRVPKDIRVTLVNRFVDPYNKRYKFGFKGEGEKAGFYQALILLIEKAQNWTINAKKP